ncbi:MAG: hypothetical protein CSA96_04655 [Bacteroidetes bacterium]|nr:MAG: hypothetical protein CSA96_04655 [Bacteroidota bacterium]
MKIKNYTYLYLLFLWPFSWSLANAASISGTIRDAESHEPIPFVNIIIKGSTRGTVSDLSGNFSLDIDSSCTIVFSSIGYLPLSKRADLSSIDAHWSIELKNDIISLPEISVRPDFSYDESMFRKVLEHKESNMEKLQSIRRYGNYDRTTILLASDSTKRLHRILSDSEDAFIRDEEKDVSYVPVYMNEEHSEVKFLGNRKAVDVLSEKRDGIFPNLNDQVENMVLEKIAIDFNFYKNQINVLDRGFRSPLSNNALLYYNIYLSDSLIEKGQTHYKFSFYPKNDRSTLFKGHFWVEKGSYALVSINARMAEEANVNFINDLNVKIHYKKQADNTWFYSRQKLQVNFSLSKHANLRIDDEQKAPKTLPGDFFINRTLQYIVDENDSTTSLSSQLKDPLLSDYDHIEQQALEGIKTLKENSVVKGVDQTGNIFLSGYYSGKIFDYGPVFDLYSTNLIEGHRFTLPLRTGLGLSEKFTLGGYLGYGTKSKELKYGASASFMLPRKKRSIVSLSYCDDYFMANDSRYTRFIQENPYSKGDGNFISAISSANYNPYAFRQRMAEISFQTDLSSTTGLLVNPYYRQSFEAPYLAFTKDDQSFGYFDSYGLMMNLRFSFGQTFDDLYFARIYYGNTKPVINLTLDLGESRLPGVDKPANYLLGHVSVKHRFNIGPAYLRYMVSGGYMHGEVPYTLLEKPYSKNSLGYSRYSYNLLNYASYAHNLYGNAHLNLIGGGVVFNHIPLVSRLNLREVVSLKAYYGMRTSGLGQPLDIPTEFRNKMPAPYLELGLGITNIFKVFRIEYVRLIDPGKHFGDLASAHGIRMRFEASF